MGNIAQWRAPEAQSASAAQTFKLAHYTQVHINAHDPGFDALAAPSSARHLHMYKRSIGAAISAHSLFHNLVDRNSSPATGTGHFPETSTHFLSLPKLP